MSSRLLEKPSAAIAGDAGPVRDEAGFYTYKPSQRHFASGKIRDVHCAPHQLPCDDHCGALDALKFYGISGWSFLYGK